MAAAASSSSLTRPLARHHGRPVAAPQTPPTPPAGLLPCRRGRAAAVLVVVPRAAGKKGGGGGGFAPAKKSGGGFGGSNSSTTTTGAKQQQQQQQMPDASAPCPCASGRAYGACCGPAHANRAPPETPELLLRSRFAAYRLGLVDYLVSTTHPDAPERRSAALGLAGAAESSSGGKEGGAAEAYRASIARTARATEFVALSVDRAGASVRPREGGSEGEEEAFLSFTVWHRPKAGGARRGGGGGGATGNESVARETSHFVKGEGGRWLYLGEAQETGGEEGARRAKEADAAAAAAEA